MTLYRMSDAVKMTGSDDTPQTAEEWQNWLEAPLSEEELEDAKPYDLDATKRLTKGLRYLQVGRDRHGLVRVYFRKGDAKKIPMPNPVLDREKFDLKYLELCKNARVLGAKSGDMPRVGEGLYVIEWRRMIKVGVSRNPQKRLVSLKQGGAMPKAELVFCYYPKLERARALEKFIHEELNPWAEDQEWFSCSIEHAIDIILKAVLRFEVSDRAEGI